MNRIFCFHLFSEGDFRCFNFLEGRTLFVFFEGGGVKLSRGAYLRGEDSYQISAGGDSAKGFWNLPIFLGREIFVFQFFSEGFQ